MPPLRIVGLCASLACSVLAWAPVTAQGQAPTAAPDVPRQPEAVYGSRIELVTMNVSVTDAADRHVPGLTRDDFQVLDDGVPQDLAFFASSQVPIDVVLLVDTSSSMATKLEFARQAATGFVRSLGPGDRAAVYEFNSRVRADQEFTDDRASLLSALTRLGANGETALYTALYVTLDRFRRERPANGEVRRQAIVVLTDGEDTMSAVRFEDVLDAARRSAVSIYAVAIVSPYEADVLLAPGERRFSSEYDFALRTLARETGGRAFFPLELRDLAGVYKSVADELATEYSIGYVPKAPKSDGMFHRLAVRILSRPDVRPRTRAGYYAAGASVNAKR